jgi:integrase
MLTHAPGILKYVNDISSISQTTAKQYHIRLHDFDRFVLDSYKLSTDSLIKRIKENIVDPYDVLTSYIRYLQDKGNHPTMCASTLKHRIITAKNFLEYHDIELSPRKFKLKVKIPKIIRRNLYAISKEDIIKILNSISNIRLKTYVMLLAATGMRGGSEAPSIRLADCDFDSDSPRIHIRGEYTKTKTDRDVFLTQELSKQLQLLIEYKYRSRRVSYFDKDKQKIITEYRTPKKNREDLIFAASHSSANNNNKNNSDKHTYIYMDLLRGFQNTIDRIHMGKSGDSNDSEKGIYKRRNLTPHTFRRYVKSTISDLGYGDFSEYFIGHIGSTYYRRTENDKIEIFRKVEPYLTFLDVVNLDRKGADVQSKVNELEMVNQKLRERDMMNTDAIASLSDKLALVTKEVELLKKQK